MSRRTELEAQTIRHLAAARYYLPERIVPASAGSSWARVEQHLHRNELRLALDGAMSLGTEVHAQKEYWREVLLAARNMELDEHACKLAEWIRTGEGR